MINLHNYISLILSNLSGSHFVCNAITVIDEFHIRAMFLIDRFYMKYIRSYDRNGVLCSSWAEQLISI